jgi:hypothetical protein
MSCPATVDLLPLRLRQGRLLSLGRDAVPVLQDQIDALRNAEPVNPKSL